MINPELEALTQREITLLAKMRLMVGGYFEEREEFQKGFNIYDEWLEIFLAYAELSLEGNIEALKRAIFFIWYNHAEPYELSGIKHIDKKISAKVLDKLNTMIIEGVVDLELRWMLPWYFFICDYYISDYPGLDALIKFSQKNELLYKTEKRKSSFENRGQLGNYWNSISSE